MSTYTEVSIIDRETGEILSEKLVFGSRSKGGWCMMYQQRGLDLIAKAPNATVLKVFMYLACGQTYQGGMKTTKRAIEQALSLSHKSVSSAFSWLKDNYIVHEWRVDGCPEFMINPQYVCVGKFDERMKMWTARFDNFKPIYSSRAYTRKKLAAAESQSS